MDTNIEPIKQASARPSFHYFPQLPTELRLKIWDHAIQPRIVQPYLDFPGLSLTCFPRRRPPPALFFANSESRQVCLEQYIVAHEIIESTVYIHPTLDTLYLSYYQTGGDQEWPWPRHRPFGKLPFWFPCVAPDESDIVRWSQKSLPGSDWTLLKLQAILLEVLVTETGIYGLPGPVDGFNIYLGTEYEQYLSAGEFSGDLTYVFRPLKSLDGARSWDFQKYKRTGKHDATKLGENDVYADNIQLEPASLDNTSMTAVKSMRDLTYDWRDNQSARQSLFKVDYAQFKMLFREEN